jgi:hypothetical protein
MAIAMITGEAFSLDAERDDGQLKAASSRLDERGNQQHLPSSIY